MGHVVDLRAERRVGRAPDQARQQHGHLRFPQAPARADGGESSSSRNEQVEPDANAEHRGAVPRARFCRDATRLGFLQRHSVERCVDGDFADRHQVRDAIDGRSGLSDGDQLARFRLQAPRSSGYSERRWSRDQGCQSACIVRPRRDSECCRCCGADERNPDDVQVPAHVRRKLRKQRDLGTAEQRPPVQRGRQPRGERARHPREGSDSLLLVEGPARAVEVHGEHEWEGHDEVAGRTHVLAHDVYLGSGDGGGRDERDRRPADRGRGGLPIG